MPQVAPDVKSMIDRFVSFKPEHQLIMDYLTASNRVPSQQTGDAGIDPHTKERNDAAYNRVNNSITYAPTTTGNIDKFPQAALHELTHAAQQAMLNQATAVPISLDSGLMRSGQFADAVVKLLKSPAPYQTSVPDQRQFAYRNSPHELQAFGQGAVAAPAYVKPTFAADSHIDMTAATEFMILLDLAMRDLAAREGGKPKTASVDSRAK